MLGTIFDIKEMAVHDGPGIRTTVFLKGCPLRCKWCHNPEGLSIEPQLMYKQTCCIDCKLCQRECDHEECKPFGRCLHICPNDCLTVSGRMVDARSLAEELKSSAVTLGEGFGGFTFSGGEPLFQSDFLLELAEHLKDFDLCIETSGYSDSKTFKRVIDKMDFIIMDIKLVNSKKHLEYTGVGNELILENFEILRASKKPYVIRTPLIPNITDTKENLEEIKAIIGDSAHETLPYNDMAGAKYKMLGMDYPLDK